MSRPRPVAAEFSRRAGTARLPTAEVGAVVRLTARPPMVPAVAGAAEVQAAAARVAAALAAALLAAPGAVHR